MVNKEIFRHAITHFALTPNIDCFATSVNSQLSIYIARQPDPYATHTDAFSVYWVQYNAYRIPPFSLIDRVLWKIRVDKATALCVFPRWAKQAWWLHLEEMMVGNPLRIPPIPMCSQVKIFSQKIFQHSYKSDTEKLKKLHSQSMFFMQNCGLRFHDKLRPTVRNIVEFLVLLKSKGYNYKQIC